MRRRLTAAVAAALAATALVGTGQLAVQAAPSETASSGIGEALSSLRSAWASPTLVDRATVTASGSSWTGVLSFSDGTSVPITQTGTSTVVTFAARTVTSAQLTVTGTDVALGALVVDRAPAAPAPTASTVVTASSASSPDRLAALSDGDPASGSTGAEWTPAAGDTSPWIQWSYATPRAVATLQVVGPSTSFVDPANSGSAALHGTLLFSDGSSVPISGIGSGTDAATTVAFAPRTVAWVRLVLARSIPQTVIGVREAQVYGAATMAPDWPAGTGGRYSVTPAAAAPCSASSTAVGSTTDGSPALVCPAIGSRVSGPTTVVVQVPASSPVTASAWVPSADGSTGAIRTIATATADARGRATLAFDAGALAHGPFAVRIQTSAGPRALYAQLDNGGGIRLSAPDPVPAGMSERFAEEFRSPVSISDRGVGTEYMAKKPEYWGGSEFGGAMFAKPEAGGDLIATVDDDYLRIRAQPLVGPDPNGWGRTTAAGLLSSARIGMTGFSAQDGYFEARILGAPGKGTWPAFWAMSTEGATTRETTQGEADAVELYGHDTSGSCRTTHDWVRGVGEAHGQGDCRALPGFTDWALTWHTYGVRITPASTDYYVDGQKVVSEFAMAQNAEPFFFMLNLATDGGWPTDLSATGGVSDMYVDWVRVYT